MNDRIPCAVKHQPATPLPWEPMPHGNLLRIEGPATRGVAKDVAVLKGAELRDVGYMAHAANAYPKNIKEHADTIRQIGHVIAALEIDGRNVGAYTKADAAAHLKQVEAKLQALLRELGEAS